MITKTHHTLQYTLVLLLTLILLHACTNADTTNNNQPTAPNSTALQLSNIEPRLQQLDSLSVLFYKDPYGNDAERYTRFYSETAITDTTQIKQLHHALNHGYVKSDTLRDCRSAGKIFAFFAGKIMQTIYFAQQPQACDHLYIIHEGAYYYMPMENRFKDLLAQWEKNAVKKQ